MIILLGLIVPLIAILFESYPRLVNRKFGVDIWTHLLYLKEYKRQKGIPKKIEGGFLVPGEYDYPPAFITLLSRIPIPIVEKYEFLFSPIFDSLHLFLIFGLVLGLTQNIYLALLTQLLYVVTPIVVLENSSATPRSLGYTLFTITFMLLYFFGVSQNYYLLVGAILVGSLIFLSHRFTSQGFLFYSIIFSIFFGTVSYIFAFVLSFTLAIIISRKFYLKVLRGHLGNLKFWYNVIDFRFYHQIKGAPAKNSSNDFVFNLYNQFLKFPPFILAITNPWVIASIFYLFIGSRSGIVNYLIVWVLTSYVLAILTLWVHKLRFLGEGQRYLELSAFPAAFVAAQLFLEFFNAKNPFVVGLYSFIIALCIVTIVVIQRKAIIKDRLRTITPELEELFKYLRNQKKKPRLLCIPHQITTNVIYHTGCSVFVNADYTNISKISDVYPYMKLDVAKVMKKHDLDAIILNEEYASIQDLKLKKYTVEKKFGNYLLITL